MGRARAQIRQPLDIRAQGTISLVDTRGQALGIVRSPDAPIVGTDVSLQKARTAAFFSNSHAASDLLASSSADVAAFVGKARTFLNDPAALTDREIAMAGGDAIPVPGPGCPPFVLPDDARAEAAAAARLFADPVGGDRKSGGGGKRV